MVSKFDQVRYGAIGKPTFLQHIFLECMIWWDESIVNPILLDVLCKNSLEDFFAIKQQMRVDVHEDNEMA